SYLTPRGESKTVAANLWFQQASAVDDEIDAAPAEVAQGLQELAPESRRKANLHTRPAATARQHVLAQDLEIVRYDPATHVHGIGAAVNRRVEHERRGLQPSCQRNGTWTTRASARGRQTNTGLSLNERQPAPMPLLAPADHGEEELLQPLRERPGTP